MSVQKIHVLLFPGQLKVCIGRGLCDMWHCLIDSAKVTVTVLSVLNWWMTRFAEQPVGAQVPLVPRHSGLQVQHLN